jgi:ketosteroid isomerase-like protein
MNNRDMIASFFASWGAQDVEWTLEHLHENVVYEIHVDVTDLPFARVTRGREACRTALFSILRDFDYLKYEPTINGENGNTVRARIEFRYRHRPTGEVYEGSRRLVFKLQDGLIIRIDGYHDAELFAAFMRLMKHRVDTNQVLSGPELPKRQREDFGA